VVHAPENSQQARHSASTSSRRIKRPASLNDSLFFLTGVVRSGHQVSINGISLMEIFTIRIHATGFHSTGRPARFTQ
jgi:hypothetical protein